MNEQRRFDEDDAMIGPAPVAEVAAAVAPEAAAPPPRAEMAPAPAPRRSGSGRLLWALVLLVAGGAAALFGGPKIAPMLPAPVAKWLTPAGQVETEALRAALESDLAAVRAELGAARTAAEAAQAQAAQAVANARTVASEVVASGGAVDAALTSRVDTLEGAMTALRGEIDAMLTQRDSTVRTLRADVAALDERVANAPAFKAPEDLEDLRARLATLEAALASDVSVRERALAEAERARRAATVTAILADIDRAMAFGRPFPEAAEALRASVGVTVAPVLTEAARTGPPTREALLNDFGPAAHRAVTEALAATAPGESGVGEVLARVQARFTGIPTEPVDGDSAPAILSRTRHALESGALDAALAEVDGLPDAAQAAMADWVAGARLRAGAEAALAALRGEIGRGY